MKRRITVRNLMIAKEMKANNPVVPKEDPQTINLEKLEQLRDEISDKKEQTLLQTPAAAHSPNPNANNSKMTTLT